MHPSPAELDPALIRQYRFILGIFIVGLILSGLTAFPLATELDWVTRWRGLAHATPADARNGLDYWLLTVRDGLQAAYTAHPWLAYGTDWLAFAHLVLAVFFVGPWVDPVRNVWVLRAGLAACVLVLPLALICGPIRGIPLGWRLVDCSFGVVGAIPLWYCLRLSRRFYEKSPHKRLPLSV